MRFPVPHCAGTSGRHLGGPAGVCRGPRALPPALPWAFPGICGALPLGIVPAAACALFMCAAPGGPRAPAMLMPVCWCAHARGTGTQLPALPRRCDFHAMPTRLRGPVAILHGDVGVTRSVTISLSLGLFTPRAKGNGRFSASLSLMPPLRISFLFLFLFAHELLVIFGLNFATSP